MSYRVDMPSFTKTITATSTGMNIASSIIPYSVITTGAIDIKPYKPEYKCPYCDTLHDHRTGVCDRCGAPLGEALEV